MNIFNEASKLHLPHVDFHSALKIRKIPLAWPERSTDERLRILQQAH